MNQILGIVQHDRLGGPSDRRFIGDQRRVEPVETVRLGGRAIDIDLDRNDPRVAHAFDCRLRGGIVAERAEHADQIAAELTRELVLARTRREAERRHRGPDAIADERLEARPLGGTDHAIDRVEASGDRRPQAE